MKIAISGFGRIGRALFRANYEQPCYEVVAIKDIIPIENVAYLLKYDSHYGPLEAEVLVRGNKLVVDGNELPYFQEKETSKLPLKELGADIMVDSSGLEPDANDSGFLGGTLNNIIYTRNAETADTTLVYGVNHEQYRPEEHRLVSASSCTGNAMAPIAYALEKEFGIESGHFVVVHPALSDQNPLDNAHLHFALGRSFLYSIIPYKTNIAESVSQVVPNLRGKLTAASFRVPTTAVTAINASFRLGEEATLEEIKKAVRKLEGQKLAKYDEGFMQQPKVSIDFIKCPYTSVVSGTETKVEGKHLSLSIFHDNEWGYACRVNDLISHIHETNKGGAE